MLELILNGGCSWLVFQKTLVKKHLCRSFFQYCFVLTFYILYIIFIISDCLQVRLNGVATFIGIVGLTVALLVLIVLLVR